MVKVYALVWSLSLLACGSKSHQSSLMAAEVESLFSQHFYDHYESGRCGPNILGFVDAMSSAGMSLEDYRVVYISNQGSGSLGMVNAQAARGILFDQPASIERNWFYHVVLVDTKTATVYDFDYKTTPTPEPVTRYIKAMFLDEPECAKPINNLSTFCVGADAKLDGYRWEWSQANRKSGETKVQTMREVSLTGGTGK